MALNIFESMLSEGLGAGTVSLKKYYQTKIDDIKEKSLKLVNRITVTKPLTNEERSVFYSSHLFASIWLFTSLGDKGKTIDEIVAHFNIPRSKALEIIKFLQQSNLCKEENGYYKMGTQNTHVEKGSPYLLHHFRNWRIMAIQQSEYLSEDEFMYTAPVSLSKKDFIKLRDEMIGFVDKFLKTVHASPAEELAYLNLDFLRIKN